MLLMTFFAALLFADTYPVKPGEKIMFLGDSITHSSYYTGLLQLMLDSRGVPGTNVMNSGIAGGKTTGGLRRIQHDVIDRNPDRVFILFGMNDVGRGELYRTDSPENFKQRKAGLDKFSENLKKIIRRLEKEKITPVLMTPTAYDQYQKDGKSDRCNEPGLSDIAQIVRATAKEENLDLIELHPFMTDALKKHPEMRLCGNDLVHPTATGHTLMTALIAEQIGLAGSVAEVTVGKDGKTVSKFAEISELQITPGKISFRYAPERMAVALTGKFADVEKIYPFSEKFNREILKITSLAEGSYKLYANGAELGSFTAADFAKGIDLSRLDTPNRKRAEKAFNAVKEIRSINSTLRYLEQCRQIAFGSKFFTGTPDPKNFDAVTETLEKWRESYGPKWPYREYYGNVIDSYRKNAPKEAEYFDALENTRIQLEKDTRPEAYIITVEKIR